MTELDGVLTPGVVGESLVLPVTYTAPARSTAGGQAHVPDIDAGLAHIGLEGQGELRDLGRIAAAPSSALGPAPARMTSLLESHSDRAVEAI